MFGWSRMGRWGFYAASALIGGTLVVGLLAHWVSWNPSDGRITRLDIRAEPKAEGAFRVTERVSVRFSQADRSPSVQRVLGKYDSFRKHRIEVDDLTLSDGSGKPLQVRTEDLLTDLRLRFDLPGGERDPVRSYVLSYTLRGVAETVGEQTVVERDFADGGFGLPVDRASVKVVGAVVGTGSCMTGPSDGRRFCRTTSTGGPIARYGDKDLGPRDGLAISTRFQPPFLDVPRTPVQGPPQAYGSRALQVASVVALGLLLIGGFATWHRRRRPRTWRKVAGIPVGVKPAEAGALYKGSAVPAHLSASLLDLVRRDFVDMSEDGVLRQRMVEGQRDELALHEWSLMLKLFGQRAEVRMDDVRSRAPEWSWEILREIERQMLENRWRVSRSTTILQRAGWLGVMLLGGLAYLCFALLSVVAWPELPLTDLFIGAGVALVFAAGCAHLLSRVDEGALTLRGRIAYAEVAAFADHVNRRGVDDDDPAMGIWAVGLGVRPDPYGFDVVPPSERPPPAPSEDDDDEDDEPYRAGFEESDDEEPTRRSEVPPLFPDDPADESLSESASESAPDAEADSAPGTEADRSEVDSPVSETGTTDTASTSSASGPSTSAESKDREKAETAETPKPAYTGRLFDDDEDDGLD